jgi:hypothetical protein
MCKLTSHCFAFLLIVNSFVLIFGGRSNIVYNQRQNGTYNVRVRIDGVAVHLPTELFEDPGHQYNDRPPLHHQQTFHDDNNDNDNKGSNENVDYDVSWFKTAKQNKKKTGITKDESDVSPSTKFMKFLFRHMGRAGVKSDIGVATIDSPKQSFLSDLN